MCTANVNTVYNGQACEKPLTLLFWSFVKHFFIPLYKIISCNNHHCVYKTDLI